MLYDTLLHLKETALYTQYSYKVNDQLTTTFGSE